MGSTASPRLPPLASHIHAWSEAPAGRRKQGELGSEGAIALVPPYKCRDGHRTTSTVSTATWLSAHDSVNLTTTSSGHGRGQANSGAQGVGQQAAGPARLWWALPVFTVGL